MGLDTQKGVVGSFSGDTTLLAEQVGLTLF